jgi:4'-phosphopantetheinyl transferase EntD
VVETQSQETEEQLFLVEERVVASAGDCRKAEFRLGRACAREALRRLTGRVAAIPRADSRAPIWPAGIVGSITHCAGLTAAAVASKSSLAALGIDAEPADIELPDGVLEFVCTPQETACLRRHWCEGPIGKVVFCAKEAVYKCINPMTGAFLNFQDIQLEFSDDGDFDAHTHSGPIPVVKGCWAIRAGYVCAVATVPYSHRDRSRSRQ